MQSPIESRIETIVLEVLDGALGTKGEGVYPVAVRVKGSAVHRKIEVVVDSDEGVRIDQCSFFARRIRERLEEDEELAGTMGEDFDLIVGSPGLGEPLVLPRQYGRHKGRLLRVRYRDPEGLAHEFTGRLLEVSLEENGGTITLEPLPEKKKGKQEAAEKVTLELASVLEAAAEPEI
ncbi:ribosome maturation factor RimP [Chlorobium sp. N1]|uniref:ribosome maturation factor RimP n=1 Tax=Chlorobium sp. N1 TaxID=2491138 RepID=UPI0010404DD5|nr:ribosome maturation factor RimP [Chlorobium sp. N1]TCD48907.1 ribosome maturation factor RimP [Chlorobium sp. N1]